MTDRKTAYTITVAVLGWLAGWLFGSILEFVLLGKIAISVIAMMWTTALYCFCEEDDE